MSKITQEELNEILKLHELWLENKETGKQADLSYMDLPCASLSGFNLSYANLSGSDLTDANLRGANLRGSDLRGSDLSNTDLSHVNLSYANLEDSDLTGADLYGSDLTGSDLKGADLTGADLRGADVKGADLSGADLTGADLNYTDLSSVDLRGANLYRAILSGVQNINTAITDEETKFLNNQCPKEGEFIGWKKCCRILYGNSGLIIGRNEYIVKLLIPYDSKRSSSTTYKCRCSKATVLAIYDMNGKEITDKEFEVYSQHDREFKYKVGQTVTPNSFDEEWWEECSNGIHFFIEREFAEEY